MAPTPADDPFSGLFGLIFFFAIVFGIGSFVWKLSHARDLARRRGEDPDEAMITTLLTGDLGLAATHLRGDRDQDRSHRWSPTGPADRGDEPDEPDEPDKTVAERLADVTALLETGAISKAEADAARARILEDL